MTTLPDLLEDLDAEYGDLREVVGGLADEDVRWDLPTPAEGWAVRDQISHLAYFDDAGRLAMVDPDAFARSVDDVLAATGDPMDVHLVRGRAMGGDGLLAWWEGAHRAMVEAFAAADPSTRVPWFGPPMGVLSFISARLMETWAHGQDVCDALGRRAGADRPAAAHRPPRCAGAPLLLRGAGEGVPPGRIDVVVAGPDGDEWRWEIGDADEAAEVATVTARHSTSAWSSPSGVTWPTPTCRCRRDWPRTGSPWPRPSPDRRDRVDRPAPDAPTGATHPAGRDSSARALRPIVSCPAYRRSAISSASRATKASTSDSVVSNDAIQRTTPVSSSQT